MIKKFFGSTFIAVGFVFFLLCVGFHYTYGPQSHLVAAVTEDCEQRIALGELEGDRALEICKEEYEYSKVGLRYEIGMYRGQLYGLASMVLALWGARLWQQNYKFTLKNVFRDASIVFVVGFVVLILVAPRVLRLL